MNANMHKLMKISGFFRGVVLIATAVVLVYLGYSYWVHDEIRFANSMLFNELWFDDRASRSVLLAIQSPILISLILGVYWLQKLLSHFQQGLFFGQQAMTCYLWLVWIKLADFCIEIVQHLVTGYYHGQFHEKTHLELPLDFGNITTLLLMLLIVYLLKAAREIEAENKEFI
ncbi:DUF2975 domain-containing protein [Shewanella sp. UCD-KL12]|uniref:DUF2975 domain-containing protein n=1 Tax=Shewanella sp. UCD-KL12 TaxID=1917163 RepID=UPI000970E792|nr:DUF2975 domain-containing protein [Shewanella sp. UCD-KL12]